MADANGDGVASLEELARVAQGVDWYNGSTGETVGMMSDFDQ